MDIGLIEESSWTMPNCEKTLPSGPIPYRDSLLVRSDVETLVYSSQWSAKEQTIRHGTDYGGDEFLEDDGYNVSGQPNQQLGAPYYHQDDRDHPGNNCQERREGDQRMRVRVITYDLCYYSKPELFELTRPVGYIRAMPVECHLLS
jgi:hypothetical protein